MTDTAATRQSPSGLVTGARWVLLIFAALFTLGAFTQFFLVGVSYFDDPARWNDHVNVGHIITVFAWLMWAPAILGKTGGHVITGCIALALLYEMQYALLDFSNTMLNALHPLNGSIMLVLGFWVTLRAFGLLRAHDVDDRWASAPDKLEGTTS